MKPLTLVQRETLEALRDGATITLDEHNMPWVGDRPLQPATLQVLSARKLIIRLDPARPARAKGNGFAVSETGLSVLAQQPPPKPAKGARPPRSTAPSDAQLAYAKGIGIDVPEDATAADVSDLLTVRLGRDVPATDEHRAIAELYGVTGTRFSEDRQLFNLIFNAVRRPTHEHDLAAWFTYRVYRDLVQSSGSPAVHSPSDPAIVAIAGELVADQQASRSLRRYTAFDLWRFGTWTAKDGSVHTGGSTRTAAYEKASSLLKARGLG